MYKAFATLFDRKCFTNPIITMNLDLNNIITMLLGGTNIFSIMMWLGEKKKRQTDVVGQIQKVYATYVEDHEKQYAELKSTVESIQKKHDHLENRVKQFERKCINNCGA